MPNLYHVTVTLGWKGEDFDEYDLSVGMRTVAVSGRKLLLNGKPVFMKGFGKHEDFMVIGKGLNHALIVKDFSLMEWIGANSFRTSHYPYSEEVLDYADRRGILVIDETPMVGLMKRNYCQEYLEKCKGIIHDLVDRDRNHPSVIMWSVANEPTSAEKEAEDFFKELYSFTKSLDDTRPVTLVTCMGIDEDVAIKYFDVICLNRYYGWYSYPGQLDEASKALEADLEHCSRKFEKPIMVTEFGADAVAGMHSDPPRQFTEEYQAEMLTQQYKIMSGKDYVIGSHVWAFADFKTSQIFMRVVLNHKGVFTRERQPKLAAHALKNLWSGEGRSNQ
jgi:beta-glucuronidase